MENKIMNKIFASIIILATVLFSIGMISAAAQSAVNLRTAGNFVILSKTGISTTGITSIVGDIGISPAATSYITGFGTLPLVDAVTGEYATSSLVTGNVYGSDMVGTGAGTGITPAMLTTAINNMQTAYTDAAGRTDTNIVTGLGAGDISGMTITPGLSNGLYQWGTGVSIDNRGVTISGSSTDIFIFQIAQDLTIADGAKVTLTGGVLPQNVFWQVAGQATLGTTSQFQGIILSQTAIVLKTGATLYGRALAQTAVTLDANAISSPDGVAPVLIFPIHVANASLTQTQILTNNSGTLLTTFTPVLDSTLLINTDAYYGINTITSAGNFPDVHWKITIARTDGTSLADSSIVAITEKGWFDPTSGAVEDSAYNITSDGTKLTGIGNSGWGTVAVDNFTNVDLIHFNTNAPLGDYVITRELVNTNTGLVISNSYVVPLTLTTPVVAPAPSSSSGGGAVQDQNQGRYIPPKAKVIATTPPATTPTATNPATPSTGTPVTGAVTGTSVAKTAGIILLIGSAITAVSVFLVKIFKKK